MVLTNKTKAEIEKVQNEFKKVWDIIIEDLRNDPEFSDIKSSMNWMEELLVKNVPFGKQTRAFLSIYMYRCLNPVRSEEDDFLNYVSGWLIEIVQASALIADDIMDNSESRRGMPCWYKIPEIGMTALNDAMLLESLAIYLSHKYFADTDYLERLIEFSNESLFQTTLGESMDTRFAYDIESGMTLNRFTEQNYQTLVKYKTTIYTFYSPVACSMIRSRIHDPKCFQLVEEITLMIGELFQIQDDFLDCFGDPTVTGKHGTDIKDGKLTWIIVKALQLASSEQRDTLEKYYGQSDDMTAEYEVKTVYEELEIEEQFYKYEESMRDEIVTKINLLPAEIPKRPFFDVLDLIYKREK